MGYARAMIRIVLADDHAIVRTGFRALIEQEEDLCIVAEAADAQTAKELVASLDPDVLVLDLSMPGGGFALLSHLHEAKPLLGLIVLSMHDREPYVGEALRRGARGYVSKGAATDELVGAVRAIHAGQSYVSTDIADRVPARPGDLRHLSEREREVFVLLARGVTPKQAAADLGISVKTVYLHRSIIRDKLAVRSDLDLHRLALESGLL